MYSKSGRIMSISLSSAENLIPASIMNISLLISKSRVFFPTSPKPPIGVIVILSLIYIFYSKISP